MSDPVVRLNAALAGRYAIERELGEGGMATVYLADDIKHERKVALKVLKPELAAVVGAERFLSEIKVTANLNHPHILPLHDSGEADGFLFYAMPYVEGESLRDRIDREKQLPVDEAVRIAAAVANALDHAHRHKVIHRDIKPANILLQDGEPVVSDFGIALAISHAGGGRLTETGLSLGTPHYMSPEQATGDQRVDGRSDVYALACVLYEMLVGGPPFMAATAQGTLAKILTSKAPSIIESRESVPLNVAAAVSRALEKLPADRVATAAKFAEALKDARLMSDTETVATAPAAPSVSAAVAWRAHWKRVVLVAAVSAAAGWVFKPSAEPRPEPVTRLTVAVPGGHEMGGLFFPNLAVSPDGRTLVYGSEGLLFKRAMDRADPEPLAGTEGACCPFFSPDGQWIAFTQAGTKRISIDGGPITEISDVVYEGAFWGSNGDVAFSDFHDGIARVAAGGGTPDLVTAIDSSEEGDHMWPQLLSGGQLVLYTVLGPNELWSDAKVVVQEVATDVRFVVAEQATFGRYLPTGHVLYARADGTIEAVPFDLNKRQVTGAAFAVESGVRTAYWGGAASFAVSDGGTLAYVRGSSWENHRLAWFDRSGRRTGEVGQPTTVEWLDLSPDGRHAVAYVASPNADIYRIDTATGDPQRLTFNETTEDNPVWAPDGRRVAFRKILSGRDHQIIAIDIAGTSDPQVLYSSQYHLEPTSWSSDGKWLAFREGESTKAARVDSLDDQATIVVAAAGGRADFSPDGRWLAYESLETGSSEIYVVSFPGVSALKRQISSSGGTSPRWSAESNELFFWSGDSLMVSQAATNGSFSYEVPRSLFVHPESGRDFRDFYDVRADGQRFLMPERNPDAPAREIHVVLNWFEELKERVGN